MITGFHTIVYSSDADVTRAFFRDVLGWPSLDAGGGWLIFKTPPSEMGVHPTSDGDAGGVASVADTHFSCSLMCDDLAATVVELRAKGVSVHDEIEDRGFGLVTSIEVPAAGSMMLYEPRHGLAHQLDS